MMSCSYIRNFHDVLRSIFILGDFPYCCDAQFSVYIQVVFSIFVQCSPVIEDEVNIRDTLDLPKMCSQDIQDTMRPIFAQGIIRIM